MSWDIMILTKDPREFSGDTKPPPLGGAGEVRTKISKSLPKVDWTDPAWGVLDGNGWSIEFNHETNGITDSIMLHLRGGSDPIVAIVKLCKDNGWVAYDTSADGLLDLAAPSAKSCQEFQAFRDKVIASTEQPPARPSLIRQHPVAFTSVGLLLIIIVGSLVVRRRHHAYIAR
jgi:hypothetical protein